MTEPATRPDPEAPAGAGALLKAAREKQGLHIAALAAAIKVSPRKLESLENERYDELPDATFARALAQTVCRALKIDAAPVLARLPQPTAPALEPIGGTLNMPFRDRSSRGEPSALAAAAVRPMVGAGVALLVAAVVVYWLPSDLWTGRGAAVELAASAPVALPQPAPVPAEPASGVPGERMDAPALAASAAVPVTALPIAGSVPGAVPAAGPAMAGAVATAAPAASSVVETVFSAPRGDAAAAPSVSPAAAATPAPARMLQLRAEAASWVEARDRSGAVLFSRLVQPGESVAFDGAPPVRLVIGNAPATQLRWRGQPVDLAPQTRDSVARIELP